MPDSSARQFPLWPLLAAAAAGVLGLALLRDRQTKASGAAPHVSLTRLDGKKQELEPGKVTLVDFWATWCAPCRASMPRVQHVFRDYTPKGVALFSIDTDVDNGHGDRDPAVREFLLQNQLDFPVALDDDEAAQEAFKVEMLPTMVVVGKKGNIAWRHIGVLDAGQEIELRRALDDALASK